MFWGNESFKKAGYAGLKPVSIWVVANKTKETMIGASSNWTMGVVSFEWSAQPIKVWQSMSFE